MEQELSDSASLAAGSTLLTDQREACWLLASSFGLVKLFEVPTKLFGGYNKSLGPFLILHLPSYFCFVFIFILADKSKSIMEMVFILTLLLSIIPSFLRKFMLLRSHQGKNKGNGWNVQMELFSETSVGSLGT